MEENSDGSLDYKSKPENNEAPDFLNTKSFVASSGLTGAAELMVLRDNVTLTAELLPTQAVGTASGTATFFAYYAALSWRPDGEPRPYDEENGTLGRVQMGDRRFAWRSPHGSHTAMSPPALSRAACSISRRYPSAPTVRRGRGSCWIAASAVSERRA